MTTVIEAKNIEVRFPGCDALRGVDLSVQSGTVFALLGENGAGKTTLIKILTGFLKPTAGSCTVLGMDPAHDAVEIRRRIGYVSDAPPLYDWMQVGEIGWFASSFYPEGFLERYRESVHRYEIAENRKIKHLSKGQRAKVALSLALAHDPELLILDEPTSGLDPLVRREFLESMIDRVSTGRTVLLSSHQISEIERVADQIAILHEGKFQLVDSLSNLHDSISKITVAVDDPLTALPALDSPAEVISEELSGRQRRFVVRNFSSEQRAELANYPGVHSVQVEHASLEDLFVACVHPRSVEKVDVQ
jgi:ABC-2 type transport system ATP-binding protein